MVRAYPFDESRHLSPQRILALSTAIGVHALVFLLLLVPMTMPPLAPALREAPQRWVIPAIPPAPPRPPEPVEAPRAPPPPSISAPRIAPQPRPLDLVTETAPPQASPPAALERIDTAAIPSPAAVESTPREGATLQYAMAPPPPYPAREARSGVEGTVVLRILVDTDGSPLQVQIQRSSGSRSLDDSARRHVLRHWRFKPAMDAGQAVQAWGLVPIDFRLGAG